MRTPRSLALTAGLVAVVALAILASASPALADESPSSTTPALAFEEMPQGDGQGGISLSVRLTAPNGEPMARKPVEFFVTPDFFAERPVLLRSALTDSRGKAAVTYAPTWNGEHRITARYAGDEALGPAEVTSILEVSGLTSTYTPLETPLGPLRQWAPPMAAAVVLAVWALLALVLVRVGWGIWQSGRASEVRVSSSPEALPVDAYGGEGK